MARVAIDELDATGDGPDFKNETDDATAREVWSVGSEPTAGPDEDMMGQFHEEDDRGLGRQLVLAESGQGQTMCIGCALGLDACPAVLGIDRSRHVQVQPAADQDGVSRRGISTARPPAAPPSPPPRQDW